MTIVHFKGCPRCHGDLHIKRDMEGIYLSCIQCGFTKDLPKVPARKPEREPQTVSGKAVRKAGRKDTRIHIP